MLSYVLPTRDRPESLARTLQALGALDRSAHERAGGAEVVVVDDASSTPARLPSRLANGLPVRGLRTGRSAGAAARNLGAEAASGTWMIMLDDDSYPLDTAVLDVLQEQAPDVAAVGAQIRLADGRREAGGLPEVIVGCGAALRREAFLDAGGYDGAFHYYAEEYDLCARLIGTGWRIVHDWRFLVRHERCSAGRNMNAIMRRLVRNNGWIVQRYAPQQCLHEALRDAVARCAWIAAAEDAAFGFEQGLDDLAATIDEQPRRPLDIVEWDRFTGRAAALDGLAPIAGGAPVAIIAAGKNEHVVRGVLADLDVPVTAHEHCAAALVIATLSPGPMMDAWERHAHGPTERGAPVVCCWLPAAAAAHHAKPMEMIEP